MTASEKLRALLGPMAFGDPEASYEENARRSFEATLTMREALPLIADVVEAAEKDLDALAERIRGTSFVYVAETDRLAATLTALTEHLEGGE